MKKALQAGALSAAFLIFGAGYAPSPCEAEIVEGRAVIENGNLPLAQRKAKEDAMRSYVEQQVGVHISSSTTTNMNMVVSDYINARSNGYVQIKKLVKEWQQDGIYCVRLDLEASQSLIDVAAGDVKKQIESVDDDSSRSGVVVAIGGFDENGLKEDLAVLNDQVTHKLKLEGGFKAVVSEAARKYIETHPDLSSMTNQAETRRIAKEARFTTGDGMEARAILRGVLNTRQVTKRGDSYVAVVEAAFQLLGLDSDVVDAFSDYATCAAPSRFEAVRKAQQEVTRLAVKDLAEQAVKTLQRENRGGVQNRKLVLHISGITDRTGQVSALVNGLKNNGCTVGRSAFDANGTMHIMLNVTMDEGSFQEMLLSLGLKQGNGENAYFI